MIRIPLVTGPIQPALGFATAVGSVGTGTIGVGSFGVGNGFTVTVTLLLALPPSLIQLIL